MVTFPDQQVEEPEQDALYVYNAESPQDPACKFASLLFSLVRPSLKVESASPSITSRNALPLAVIEGKVYTTHELALHLVPGVAKDLEDAELAMYFDLAETSLAEVWIEECLRSVHARRAYFTPRDLCQPKVVQQHIDNNISDALHAQATSTRPEGVSKESSMRTLASALNGVDTLLASGKHRGEPISPSIDLSALDLLLYSYLSVILPHYALDSPTRVSEYISVISEKLNKS